MLTVLMYHYVRPIAGSPYPNIKGRELEAFEGQLDYLARHYVPVTLDDIVDAARGNVMLPGNAFYLTFDDGFAEHYEHVLPRLLSRGLTGAFYPPAKPILEKIVLDVHKLHFVLSVIDNSDALVSELLDLVAAYRDEFSLPSDDVLLEQHRGSSRFDPPEIVFVKRMLQVVLPENLRRRIVGILFERHVTSDESGFAAELYLNLDQLREMVSSGMSVGSHGYDHRWWGSLSAEEQMFEIDQSLELIDLVYGARPASWTVCYPYGNFNEDTLRLARERGCALGWTTRVALVEDFRSPLALPRLDTNDLPASRHAQLVDWTSYVVEAANRGESGSLPRPGV